MPELPDVEPFKRVLARNCLDRIIKSAAVKDARILGELSAEAFTAHLRGRRLVAAHRHGKHLLAAGIKVALAPNQRIDPRSYTEARHQYRAGQLFRRARRARAGRVLAIAWPIASRAPAEGSRIGMPRNRPYL